MENFEFTRDLILVLGTAFLGGFAARKLRQPLLTGYILGGVVIGGLSSRFLQPNGNLGTMAQIGVAFLMFTLGLEFSWEKFRKIGSGILLAAVAQILITIILGIIIFPRFGFDFYSSIFLGSAFSLSSTAVVVKVLSERAELDTLPSELTTSWLILQDLAVLPMVVILPALAFNLKNGTGFLPSLTAFSQAVIKAVFLLGLVLLLGKNLMPFLTDKILKTHSRELLLLSVVSFCLVLAFGTASLGLSFAVGAFLAGFLVSKLGISASIFAEVRPLRDIFAVIFFVTLGFLTSPQFLLSHSLTILVASILIILVKFLIVSGLMLYLGYHTKNVFLVAVALSNVGEFAPVLGQMGQAEGIISPELNLMIISVTLLTLVLTPWMMSLAPTVYFKIKAASANWEALAAFFARFDRKPTLEGQPLKDHVVILGFGRVGKYIGRALQMENIPFVVVDYNHEVIEGLRDKGLKVVYGDPGELPILDSADVPTARAVIIAIPDRQTQEMIIANVQTLKPGIKIICRTHHEEDQALLRALRVDTIIQPEFEAALSIVNKLLLEFGTAPEEIGGKIKRLKIEHGMV